MATASPAPAPHPTAPVRHPAAPAGEQGDGLPHVPDPQEVSPRDARGLSKLFFDRLRVVEEGSAEYAYARNTLIELNMSLVHFAARRFQGRDQMEDVLQVGMIGLIKAIDRFDLSRENEFATFAIPYIVGEIKRYFRDATWAVHVPRRLQELRVELAQARDRLGARLDRDPTPAELAEHLGRGEEEVLEGLIAANGYNTDSLDMPYDQGGGSVNAKTMSVFVGAVDPGMERVENLQSLAPLVAELPERDRRILEMRFGREWTQAQIGEALGCSQMHVSRLLSRIIRTLRAGLLADC
ncbi:SigB/SigF/SigG family RNA polymerase sigma factor [Streptomyces fuscigenes]|uniref:SigB/SigF/SigG family RNA polymerase sigma factor n=1 Tax=Streptomyces fuscigenes TaxID=1528880 RepID=UPI001F314544|nr:SigB/SigF/SigG family RNA polymerase sigma factor [Streptomyces fuscigenes]MCF3963715.1 SigB/SigF/SigG family RNA polymerase sigma factor [Streptomyces fuscigenes]